MLVQDAAVWHEMYGMKCSMACGQCRGTSGSNAAAFAEELEGESESDDE